MRSAALVWLCLVIGLKVVGAGGAWALGWGGALGVGTLLWPTFAGGYLSLQRLMFSNAADRLDETRQMAWDAVMGLPLVAVSFCFSALVLGMLRFLGSFSTLPSGGTLNFLMSVFALHVFVWGLAGAAQWAWAAWRNEDD